MCGYIYIYARVYVQTYIYDRSITRRRQHATLQAALDTLAHARSGFTPDLEEDPKSRTTPTLDSNTV